MGLLGCALLGGQRLVFAPPQEPYPCWVSDGAPGVLVCLLWQEWSEAKGQLSFALSMGADIASRGSNHSETWQKMGIHILGTRVMGSPLALCHMRHMLSRSCPHGLTVRGGAVGFASPVLPGRCLSQFCSRVQLALRFCQQPCDLSWTGQHRL